MLSHPVVLSSAATIVVTYTDTSTDNVAVAAGTYYIQGDGASDDLIQVLEDAFNADADGTWDLELKNNSTATVGHVAGQITPGAKTVSTITWDTTYLPGNTLGFTAVTSNAVLQAGSTNRCASIWVPITYDTREEPEPYVAIVGNHTGGTSGVTDYYTGHTIWHHELIEVYAAEVKSYYTGISAHVANVSGLAASDPNASLQAWLESYRTLCNGATPTCRWTSDTSDYSTYRSVRITDTNLVAGPEAWIAERNPAPLWYDLRFKLSEVPS